MLRCAPILRLPPPNAAMLCLLPLCVLGDGPLFWPAACLVAIAAACARQHGAMLACYGLAVGFDANALLLAPFIAAVVIGARVPARICVLAPALALAMAVARSPGAAPGLALPSLALAGDAPSVWTILHSVPWVETLPLGGLAVTSMLGVAVAYGVWTAARPLRPGDMLDSALLCALALPVLLPAGGPRALLLAAALAALLALLDPSTRRQRIAALVLLGMVVAALGTRGGPEVGAIVILAALLLQARGVLKPAANDNPPSPWVASPRSPFPLPLQRETC